MIYINQLFYFGLWDIVDMALGLFVNDVVCVEAILFIFVQFLNNNTIRFINPLTI